MPNDHLRLVVLTLCLTAVPAAAERAGDLAHGFGGGAYARADTLVLPAGRYELRADVEIDSTTTVLIRAGATCALGPDVGILCRGRLVAEGSEAAPVTFTWLAPDSLWGSVLLLGSGAEGSVFRHTVVEHGSNKEFTGELFASGAVVSYQADVDFLNCRFRDNEGGDCLNVVEARSLVDHCIFERSQDAIDFDRPDSCRIVHSEFYDSQDDAIDLGGPRASSTLCRYNRIEGAEDKGFSVEGLSALIENNLVVDTEIAIALKDGSESFLANNTLVGNAFGLKAYQKTPGRGGGGGMVIETIIWAADSAAVDLDSLSTTAFRYCAIEGGWVGTGNIDADPLFAEYQGFSQLLAPGSPCIDAGDPARADGIEWPPWYPNGTRADIGAYGGPGAGGWGD